MERGLLWDGRSALRREGRRGALRWGASGQRRGAQLCEEAHRVGRADGPIEALGDTEGDRLVGHAPLARVVVQELAERGAVAADAHVR